VNLRELQRKIAENRTFASSTAIHPFDCISNCKEENNYYDNQRSLKFLMEP